MRRLAALLAALGLAACGGGDAPPPTAPAPAAQGPIPTPTPTPAPRVSAPVRRALAGGRIGVVDYANRAHVAPAELVANKQQELERLEWRNWGRRRATARGTVRTLDCDPTCAQGNVHRSSATVTLSRPRVCGSRRFYSRGSLRFRDEAREGEPLADAAVFLRTPC